MRGSTSIAAEDRKGQKGPMGVSAMDSIDDDDEKDALVVELVVADLLATNGLPLFVLPPAAAAAVLIAAVLVLDGTNA